MTQKTEPDDYGKLAQMCINVDQPRGVTTFVAKNVIQGLTTVGMIALTGKISKSLSARKNEKGDAPRSLRAVGE